MHPDDRLGVQRQIRAVQFLPTAVAISYFTVPDDLRKTGLAVNHEILIPLDTNEYAEEFTDAYDALQRLLNDAAEDWQNLEPYNPEEDNDDDDDDQDADDEED